MQIIIKKAFIFPVLFSFVFCTSSTPKETKRSEALIPLTICDYEWFWFQTDQCIASLQRPITISQIILTKNDLNHSAEDFAAAMNAYTAVLMSAKRDVERSSLKRINLTIMGIVSSISAAALATASPANAATVAGLAAFSSGIITYQGVLVEEGNSRAALSQTFDKLRARQEALHKEFNISYLTAVSENPNTLKYNESIAKIKLIILELYVFAYKIPSNPKDSEIQQAAEKAASSRKILEDEFKVLNEKMKNAKDDKEKNELLEKFNKKIIDIINAYLSTH